MPARAPAKGGQARRGQAKGGPAKRGSAKGGQASKRRAGSKGRYPGRGSVPARSRQSADPILILGGWVARLIVGAWMVAAHAVGGTARAFGKSARDMDPLHRRDGLGLAYLAAAIVAVAATWVHMTNLPSRLISGLLHGAFGSAAWLLPFLLGLLAWRYLRHPDRNAQTGRMVIGWTALMLGALGLIHIAAGTPHPSAGTAAMQSGGGLIGFAVSAPLVAGLTPWFAAPLLALVSGFGLLVITGTPLHKVPDRLSELRGFAQRDMGEAEAGPEEDGQPEVTGQARPLIRGGRKRPQAIEAGEHHRPYDTPILPDGTAGPGGPAGPRAGRPWAGGAGRAGRRGGGGRVAARRPRIRAARRVRPGGRAGRGGAAGGGARMVPRPRMARPGPAAPGPGAGPSSSPSPGRPSPATSCRRWRCSSRAARPRRGPGPTTWWCGR